MMMMIIIFARKACETAFMDQRHYKKKLVFVEGRIVENTV